MQIHVIVLLVLSLMFIGAVIDDVEYKIPIIVLAGETIAIFIASYLDGQRDDNPNWVYGGVLAYAVVALFFVIYNFGLQY